MSGKTTHMIAFILMAVGGLNWLLVGAASMNLVTMLLGEGTMATKVVYILVGLATLYEIFTHKKNCTACS
jgi:hypothetical protein